jgi:hypothetical protein
MLVAVLGAGIGAAVLLADWWTWPGGTWATLGHSSPFVLWAALICAQTTLWTLAAAPVWSMLQRNRAGWNGQRAEIVRSGLLLVAFVGAMVGISNLTGPVPSVFPHQHAKVWSLTGVALVLALGVAATIWLIRGRLKELRSGESDREIELFITFRGELERLLGILGAIVGLAVLATAALRQVVLEYAARHPKAGASFPPDYPILYGLILSLVVALAYLPTYLALLQAGSDLRDRGAPLRGPGEPDFEAVIAKRKTLTELLGLDISASTSFRVGATILSPLFAALVSLLPKLGG